MTVGAKEADTKRETETSSFSPAFSYPPECSHPSRFFQQKQPVSPCYRSDEDNTIPWTEVELHAIITGCPNVKEGSIKFP